MMRADRPPRSTPPACSKSISITCLQTAMTATMRMTLQPHVVIAQIDLERLEDLEAHHDDQNPGNRPLYSDQQLRTEAMCSTSSRRVATPRTNNTAVAARTMMIVRN